MSATSVILIILFAAGAAFTQRVSGFGFGIFIMTVLPHIMPSYGEATALSGSLAVITSVITAVNMRKHLNIAKLWPILLTFIMVSFFSVILVTKVDSRSLKHILGGVLIAVSIYFFFFSGKLRMKPNYSTQASMGAISGLMGGLFAMQGPPAVIYFVECSDDKDEYIALTQWYFLVGNLVMTLFRAGHGLVTPVVCKSFLIGVPAVLAGLWIGAKVYDRVNARLLKKLIYGYMAIAGVITILS